MKKVTTITQESDQPLVKAADMLLSVYKEPSEFICFLSRVSHWMYEISNTNFDEPTSFNISLLQRTVGCALVSQNADKKEVVTVALAKFAEGVNREEMMGLNTMIIACLHHSQEEGESFPQHMQEYIIGVKAIVDLGVFIDTYNYPDDHKELKIAS